MKESERRRRFGIWIRSLKIQYPSSSRSGIRFMKIKK